MEENIVVVTVWFSVLLLNAHVSSACCIGAGSCCRQYRCARLLCISNILIVILVFTQQTNMIRPYAGRRHMHIVATERRMNGNERSKQFNIFLHSCSFDKRWLCVHRWNCREYWIMDNFPRSHYMFQVFFFFCHFQWDGMLARINTDGPLHMRGITLI